MIIILCVLVCIPLLYLFLMKPRKIRNQSIWNELEQWTYAHRGFFNNKEAYPENSLPAFQRAVDANFGIELDVQMTTDGKLVVFHDGTLKRMCGVDKMLHMMSFDECQQYTLKKSNEKIPLFEDVLKVVDGKVPLIVEIKYEGKPLETVEKTCQMLESYKGLYVMESFHPGVVYWLKKNRPHILRGQLSEDYQKYEWMNWIGQKILTNCLLNGFTKPDFVAYDIRCKDYFTFSWMCKLFKFKKVCWTIKNEDQLKEAKTQFDMCIFDSFDPRERI